MTTAVRTTGAWRVARVIRCRGRASWDSRVRERRTYRFSAFSYRRPNADYKTMFREFATDALSFGTLEDAPRSGRSESTKTHAVDCTKQITSFSCWRYSFGAMCKIGLLTFAAPGVYVTTQMYGARTTTSAAAKEILKWIRWFVLLAGWRGPRETTTTRETVIAFGGRTWTGGELLLLLSIFTTANGRRLDGSPRVFVVYFPERFSTTTNIIIVRVATTRVDIINNVVVVVVCRSISRSAAAAAAAAGRRSSSFWRRRPDPLACATARSDASATPTCRTSVAVRFRWRCSPTRLCRSVRTCRYDRNRPPSLPGWLSANSKQTDHSLLYRVHSSLSTCAWIFGGRTHLTV